MRVLLADDQEMFVQMLARVLSHDAKDIEIVGISRNGEDAIKQANSLHPDLILMDVRMPIMDGVEATKAIRTANPETKIIVLTTFRDDKMAEKAIAYGAVGYLLKDSSIEDLISCIRIVNSGIVLIPDQIATKTMSENLNRKRRDSRPEWLYELNRSERRVLQMMVEGWDNSEIASRLNLGKQTVKNYVSSLYNKIGIHDRAKIVRMILDSGIPIIGIQEPQT